MRWMREWIKEGREERMGPPPVETTVLDLIQGAYASNPRRPSTPGLPDRRLKRGRRRHEWPNGATRLAIPSWTLYRMCMDQIQGVLSFYALSATEAVFRARTHNYVTYPVRWSGSPDANLTRRQASGRLRHREADSMHVRNRRLGRPMGTQQPDQGAPPVGTTRNRQRSMTRCFAVKKCPQCPQTELLQPLGKGRRPANPRSSYMSEDWRQALFPHTIPWQSSSRVAYPEGGTRRALGP